MSFGSGSDELIYKWTKVFIDSGKSRFCSQLTLMPMNAIFSLILPPSMIEKTDSRFSLAMQMRQILKSMIKTEVVLFCDSAVSAIQRNLKIAETAGNSNFLFADSKFAQKKLHSFIKFSIVTFSKRSDTNCRVTACFLTNILASTMTNDLIAHS